MAQNDQNRSGQSMITANMAYDRMMQHIVAPCLAAGTLLPKTKRCSIIAIYNINSVYLAAVSIATS